MSRRSAKLGPKCSTCGMTIDRRTVENLLRTSHQENRQALASQKRDYERRISQLKGEQKKTLVRFTQSSRQARKKAKREAEEKARQDRILFEQEFSRLKAAYQTNLTQLKEFYTRQNVAGLNELRVLLSDYAEEAKKHFNNAIEDQRSQMHEVQAWLQNELPRQLLQLSSEQVDDSGIAEAEMIEEALDTDSLSREIQARDELIEKAGARIRSLEEKLAPKQGKTLWKRMRRSSPPEPYKDEEPTDPQQEVLNMIREIAHERETMERDRVTAAGPKLPARFADSFGSRMSKTVSH